jgi:uncharacterized protein
MSIQKIAVIIGATSLQVKSAVDLLDGGATVPFIARYRKEVTGGLDDIQLRKLEESLIMFRALESRRQSIEKILSKQGVLTAVLKKHLESAQNKTELEDIYAPFKTVKTTKASQARDKGLEPLAEALKEGVNVDELLKKLKRKKISTEDAYAGAREILVDEVSKNIPLLKILRNELHKKGVIKPRAVRGKSEEAKKWVDEVSNITSPETIPAHRALGLLRAVKEGVLALDIDIDSDVSGKISRTLSNKSSPLLKDVGEQAWKGRIGTTVQNQVLSALKERAHIEAIDVFKKNLKDLLLAAPAGRKVILGLDPGLRTGVKAAIIDQFGKVLITHTFYVFSRGTNSGSSQEELVLLLKKYDVEIIAIGNGTGGRETESWVSECLKKISGKKPQKVIVSEAGASVYSASEIASKELSTMDVSLRGAVSIARRLQDPLAELVKIDPKALGIGQYQHDIEASKLEDALKSVIEDAVASVGVDVNSASPSLLSYVPGIGPVLAEQIMLHREKNGPFKDRSSLLKVSRLGPKVFEQCAGFLRVPEGKNPLDRSALHPETYALAKDIAKLTHSSLDVILGNAKLLNSVDPTSLVVKGKFGLVTIKDVLAEMARPGRDPRPEFKTAFLDDKITEVTDLKVGMRLEGTITNVTSFGAFVDLGVHQDGLVHISHLSDSFVSNPSEIVSVGQIVKVCVLEIDVDKKRIALSMKTSPEMKAMSSSSNGKDSFNKNKVSSEPKETQSSSPFDALKKFNKK